MSFIPHRNDKQTKHIHYARWESSFAVINNFIYAQITRGMQHIVGERAWAVQYFTLATKLQRTILARRAWHCKFSVWGLKRLCLHTHGVLFGLAECQFNAKWKITCRLACSYSPITIWMHSLPLAALTIFTWLPSTIPAHIESEWVSYIYICPFVYKLIWEHLRLHLEIIHNTSMRQLAAVTFKAHDKCLNKKRM